jgi:hypothetical protein
MLFQKNLISLDTPILITSAIKASALLTSLVDTEKRLSLLANSLHLWAAIGVRQIVVCDGSTVDISIELSRFIDCSALSCQIELLGFVNSISHVSRLGKGYGEGEIVKHALAHSKLIAKSDYFVKCTGKLFVANYLSVIKGFRGEFGCSFGGQILLPQYVDTRFYIASKDFFVRNLAEVYISVNDPFGIYLENVYFAVLMHSGLSRWMLGHRPRFVGISGTTGEAYKYEKLYFLRYMITYFIWISTLFRSFLSKISSKARKSLRRCSNLHGQI